MKSIHYLLIPLLTLMMSACATMNDEFSCSKSAFDHCLDIEDVDAMTEGKTVIKKSVTLRSQQWAQEDLHGKEMVLEPKRPVWIAPYKDEGGQNHSSRLLYADKAKQTHQSQG